jgi:hypothetical protein
MRVSLLLHSDKYHLAASILIASMIHASGPVAQWIRHRPTEPGIAGSSPAGVIFAAAVNEKEIAELKRNLSCVPFAYIAVYQYGPTRARTADLTVISRTL